MDTYHDSLDQFIEFVGFVGLKTQSAVGSLGYAVVILYYFESQQIWAQIFIYKVSSCHEHVS